MKVMKESVHPVYHSSFYNCVQRTPNTTHDFSIYTNEHTIDHLWISNVR